jgi:large subunit ribosomal protein L25
MKLSVKKREELKRKVKGLLKKNEIPGVVYGPKRKSLNIKFDGLNFEKVLKDSGYSKLVDLEVEEEKPVKVLIREVQYEPATDKVIHVSFYELDMKKTITADVPVETKGTSTAVKDNTGFLVTPFDTLTVRCLPDKLPQKLVVDISLLNEIGDNVSIADLKLPEGVELSSEIDQNATLAYIAPPQKEIVEEEPEEEAEEEGEEGEVKEGEEEEGEEKTEEGKEAEGEKKSEEKESKDE